MQQHFTAFTATPHGIMMDGLPLHKSASRTVPTQTLRYVKRAEELLAAVKKENWDSRAPHGANNVTTLAKAQMMLALASPQTFPPASSSMLLAKAGFNTDESRDERGRWTNGDVETHIEHYEPVAYTTQRRSTAAPNRYVSAKDGITEADIKNPRFNGMDNTQIKKQKFVDANLADAEKGAKQLNVPVENLLALSALESGWGRGDLVLIDKGNNFFGLHHPASFETGSRQAQDNPKVRIAEFDSYSDSVRSFVEDYGYLVQGISNPTQFARNLQNSGNFGIDKYGRKVPTYVSDISGTAQRLPANIARTKTAK